MFDGEAFGQKMADMMKAHVERAVAPLVAEIADLKKRAAEPAALGFADAMIDFNGSLVLIDSAGKTKEVGRVVGKDGQPGANGRHGTSANDVNVKVLDDGRTLELSFTQGDVTHSFDVAFPFPMYRDVYREGATYAPGDLVTFGGSVWHCNAETTTKPGSDAEIWTLAVKRGRDGKSAK